MIGVGRSMSFGTVFGLDLRGCRLGWVEFFSSLVEMAGSSQIGVENGEGEGISGREKGRGKRGRK